MPCYAAEAGQLQLNAFSRSSRTACSNITHLRTLTLAERCVRTANRDGCLCRN